MNVRGAYRLLMWANKRYIKKTYGDDYYSRFEALSSGKLNEIEGKIPDIGDSIFVNNYAFVIAYVPFFYGFKQLDETKDRAGELVWVINENLCNKIPKLIWLKIGRMSSSNRYIKVLKEAQVKGENGLLNPLDWRVEVIEHPDGTFCCNIKECGALKVLKKMGEDDIFPYPCRLDYMLANLKGTKFERDKTLADGDECCNCNMLGKGYTEWAPEKGFTLRK